VAGGSGAVAKNSTNILPSRSNYASVASWATRESKKNEFESDDVNSSKYWKGVLHNSMYPPVDGVSCREPDHARATFCELREA